MKGGALLALAFLACSLVQYSFVFAFGGAFVLLSLLTIGGILVFQRVGPEEGAAWFLAIAVFHGLDVYPIIWAMLGPLLLARVFTTRSVYALFGLGFSGHLLASGMTVLFEKIAFRFFPLTYVPLHTGESLLLQSIILLPGLFVGVVCIRFLERSVMNRLYIRRP